jgi:hypothetical protein
MLGLFLLGLMVPSATARSAQIATVIGVLLVAWNSLLPKFGIIPEGAVLPLHPLLLGLVGTAAILFFGWLLALGRKRI